MPFAFELERGLIRLNQQEANGAAVVERYRTKAYTSVGNPPVLSEWGDRLGQWYFRELAERVGDLSGKTVLDIGSGTRYVAERMVNELRARRVIICDPAMKADQGSGAIEVVPAYFEASCVPHGRIDMVVSINNLEHVLDPWRYLTEVRGLLEVTEGPCFLIVPECARQLRVGDWGLCVHEHLSYFTEASFVATVTQAGFAVEWMKIQDDTLLALLTPAAPGEAPDDASEVALLRAAVDRFHQNLDRLRDRFSTATRGAGRRLALHGCTVGLNTILARLGIRSDPALFLFDGDSAKTGKYLPAFDRPILHARDPQYRSMTNLIIAATTFYGDIRASVMDTHRFDPSRIEPLFPLQ